MDAFNAIVHTILSWWIAGFSWGPPAAGLAVISILAGAGMLWIAGRTSSQEKIRAVKRRISAHILELRVFRDEPWMMWRAQRSLLAANLRYIGLMLRPMLWMAPPLAILLAHLDSFYGRAPLAPGKETIVTVALRTPIDLQGPPPALTAPRGVLVETPAVRIVVQRQISWRIRPIQPVSGKLRLTVNGETVEKRIAGRRVSSLFDAIRYPEEPRIRSASIDWVEVQTPVASMAMFGIRAHWLVWFTLISMASALALKKRFGVVL